MSGLQLLRAYTALKRDGDAVQIALDLTRLHPDDPEILYHAGRLFGNFAYLNMEKLTAVAPKSVWRLLAAGEALESQGNFELAAVRYREVIAQAPERPGIHFRLGRALLKQDQAPQAAEEFERELSVDPTNGNAAYELAEIHRKAGPAEKARRYFELALKHDPDFEDALIGLAKVLAAEGRHDAALPHLRKAIALNPANEVSHYQLARAHRALGNAAEERKELAEFQRLRALARVQENLLRGLVTRQQTDDER